MVSLRKYRCPLLIVALLVFTPDTGAHAQLQTVLRKLDPAPVAAGEYKKFRSPVPGDANGGEIAFRATVKADVGIKGIWREPGTGVGSGVASKGDSGQGFSFRNFKRPVPNAAGDIAWFAFVTPQGSGVFRSQAGGGLKVAALEKSPSPLGGSYRRFFIPSLTASGRVVFWASIDQGSSDEAILSCSGGDGDCSTGSGTIEVLAKSGDAISDRPGREVCEFEEGLHASNWGVAFVASTKSDCAKSAELAKQGVFRKSYTGGIETVALAGEGSSLGGGFSVYTKFRDRPMIESTGKIVFRSSVSLIANSDALFLCQPPSCPGSPAQMIVEKGQDDALGNTLRKISSARIDDAGDVCFHAKAKGPSAKGDAIYIRRAAGTLDRLVSKGNLVPDQPGATFRRVKIPFMSPAGRIAFKGAVAGSAFSGPAQFLFEP